MTLIPPPPPRVKDAWNDTVRAVYTSSDKMNWQTPPWLFAYLNAEFNFTIDVGADATNHLCPVWIGPGGLHPDALKCSWRNPRARRAQNAFNNPPYGRAIGQWYQAARRQVADDVAPDGCDHVVMLANANTETEYWADHVWPHAAEVRFIQGRVQFVDPDLPDPPPPGYRKDAQTKGSAIIVWQRGNRRVFPRVSTISVWDMGYTNPRRRRKT